MEFYHFNVLWEMKLVPYIGVDWVATWPPQMWDTGKNSLLAHGLSPESQMNCVLVSLDENISTISQC